MRLTQRDTLRIQTSSEVHVNSAFRLRTLMCKTVVYKPIRILALPSNVFNRVRYSYLQYFVLNLNNIKSNLRNKHI